MAKPIQPTPVLCDQEARTFLKTVRENEDRPAYKVECAKIARAVEIVRRDASWNKKHG